MQMDFNFSGREGWQWMFKKGKRMLDGMENSCSDRWNWLIEKLWNATIWYMHCIARNHLRFIYTSTIPRPTSNPHAYPSLPIPIPIQKKRHLPAKIPNPFLRNASMHQYLCNTHFHNTSFHLQPATKRTRHKLCIRKTPQFPALPAAKMTLIYPLRYLPAIWRYSSHLRM